MSRFDKARSTKKEWDDRAGGIDGIGPHYPKRGIKNKGREEI